MMEEIINGKELIPNREGHFFTQENNHILFDKKINKILEGEIPQEIASLPKENIINANTNYTSPGFINIHTYGAMGADAMD